MSSGQKATAAPATQSYCVLRDGHVAGRPRKEGDVVQLTPAEAKYENLAPEGEAVAAAGNRITAK